MSVRLVAKQMAPLLTAKETAEILRVHVSTLSRWSRQNGVGPAVVWLSPNTPRYVRSEVEAFATGQVGRRS